MDGLFSPWFRDRTTWQAWRVFLRALFALPMEPGDQDLYRQCTGREQPPEAPVTEAWLIVGRRGGKSFIVSLIAVYLAIFRDYRPFLSPGERATIMVIATDRRQARIIMRYIMAMLTEVPALAPLIERETAESIDLANRVTIEIHTTSFRSTRGYTLAAVLMEELAFWRSDESATPDKEVINALKPGMATIPGAVMLGISSPYARKGALWDAYRRHYGKDSPALVWQAPTATMNPSIPQDIIDRAYEEDPIWAAAEYGAEFRSDIEAFLSREAVESCIIPERHELPPTANLYYRAFVDPSGGSQDSMTLAIAHFEDGRPVLDLIRERRPPFSPESVTKEFAEVLKSYHCRTVTGDRYGGEWPRERFSEHGIEYRPAAKPKSDLYREMLPLINAGKAELLDNTRLLVQLVSLERRTARGGRDSIDHGPGGHDDVANSVAGALLLANKRPAFDSEGLGAGLRAASASLLKLNFHHGMGDETRRH